MISIQSEISYSLLNKILMLCHQHVMHFSANKISNLQYLIFKKANIPRPILPDPAECGYEMSDIGLKPILMTKDQIPNSVLKMYLAIVQQIAKIIVADVGNWDYHVIFILDAQSHAILSPVITLQIF